MRTFLSILLISLCGYLSAAKYTIIETFGIVKLCTTDRQLHHGDIININSITELCLIDKGDTTAMALMLNADTRVNYVLIPTLAEGKKKNKLIPLKDDGYQFNLTPPQNAKGEIAFLKSFFSEPKRVILGEEFSIPIRHLPIPRKLAPFRIDYSYKGKRVTKYMYTQNNQISFKEAKIYIVDGNPINPREAGPLNVYYRYETYTKLGTFRPIFLDEEKIKREINHFLKINTNALQSGPNRYKTINNLMDLFNHAHGLGDSPENREWVNTYLNSKLRRRVGPGRAKIEGRKAVRNN
ncbi:MAG: hypothetical protein R8P61_31060 [Bacteroidia bacterium]|nr:hypothetical protein [Bacteroidia bacterium]